MQARSNSMAARRRKKPIFQVVSVYTPSIELHFNPRKNTMKKPLTFIACLLSGYVCASTTAPAEMEPFPAGTPSNQVTPNAAPKPQWWANPYLTADFIWWKTTAGGLYYAVDGILPGNTPALNAKKGKIYDVEMKYEPGFKVGFGLNFKHDGWDFYSEYTRLHTGQMHNSASSREEDTLNGTWLVQNPGGAVTEFFPLLNASANWHAHLDMLDLELGRNYYISRFLTLRPYIGLKLVWTDQHLRVLYEHLDQQSSFLLKMKQEVMGTGIQAGLDTAWHMCKNWSVFGNFCLSGLWNDYDVKRTDDLESTGINSRTLNVAQNFQIVQPFFNFGLGVRYETWFYHDYYHFSIQAGWEELLLPDYNQLIALYNEQIGDLSFQGLSIQARFDF